MAAPTEITDIARKFIVDIDTGYPGGGPTWVQLTGITDFKPMVDETLQSRGTYDNDWEGSQRTKLKFTAEVTFLRNKTLAGVGNAAAEKIRTSTTEFGEAGLVHFRYYDREGGDEAYEAYCNAKWARANTAHDDLDAVTVTFTDFGQGRIEIVNPAA